MIQVLKTKTKTKTMRIEVKWGGGNLLVLDGLMGMGDKTKDWLLFSIFTSSNVFSFPIFTTSNQFSCYMHGIDWLIKSLTPTLFLFISLVFSSLSLSQLCLATPLSIFANVKLIKWWLKEEKETKKAIFDARRREIVTAMTFLGRLV